MLPVKHINHPWRVWDSYEFLDLKYPVLNTQFPRLSLSIHFIIFAMGSWDCYCAICGSTFCGVEINKKTRSVRVRRQQRHQQQRGSQAVGTAKDDNTGSNNADDDEEYEEVEGEEGYDAAVINEEETEWVRTLHILGFNKSVSSTSK